MTHFWRIASVDCGKTTTWAHSIHTLRTSRTWSIRFKTKTVDVLILFRHNGRFYGLVTSLAFKCSMNLQKKSSLLPKVVVEYKRQHPCPILIKLRPSNTATDYCQIKTNQEIRKSTFICKNEMRKKYNSCAHEFAHLL